MKITSSFFQYWTPRTTVFPQKKSDEKLSASYTNWRFIALITKDRLWVILKQLYPVSQFRFNVNVPWTIYKTPTINLYDHY